MFKKLFALLLALLLPAGALAEVYEGVTAALSTVSVSAESAGTVAATAVRVGARVEAGDALATLRADRTFSTDDGTVALVNVSEGDEAEGSVLEVAPLERYQIYCTVDKAYQSAASTLVHSGETVYIRCTADGTHRAVGRITLIEGETYRVLTLGGELYVGETVYLYRDADFTAAERVGIGTVVVNDTLAYEAAGRITRLCVQAGDAVERGQLLFEIGGGEIQSPVGGIVTVLNAEPGAGVEAGQAVAQIVPDGQVCVEIQVPESAAAAISPGQSATLTCPGGDEDALSGTVLDISRVADDGAYTVRVLPQESAMLPLGMSVSVRL